MERGPAPGALRDEPGSVLGQVPVPAVLTDDSGSIRFANVPFADMVGLDAGELRGRPLAGLAIPEDRELLARRRAAVLSGDPGRDILVRLQRLGGVRPALIAGAAVDNERAGARLVLWLVLRPGWWRPEPGPSDIAELAMTLGHLGFGRHFDGVPLNWMTEAAGCCRVVTGRGSEVGLMIRRTEGPDLLASTSDTVQRWGRAQLDVGEGPVIAAARDSEVISTVDLSRDRRFPALPDSIPPGRSAVSHPIALDGSVVGALTVYDGHPDLLLVEDLVLPSLAAAMAAVAAEISEVGSRLNA